MTHGIWTDEELQKVIEGDERLTAELSNESTFLVEEARVYNQIAGRLHAYDVYIVDEDEPIRRRATSDVALWEYLRKEWMPGAIVFVFEIITHTRPIDVPEDMKAK